VTPKFLYFDLGMVLVTFSVRRMCQQMADVTGLAPERVQEALFDGQIQHRYEMGQIATREFYEAFCQATHTRADFDRLLAAASDIFEIHAPTLPVVAQLRQAGHRLGILSNTCEAHWEHCLGRYRVLAECFDVYALSYRTGTTKPDVAIFRAAAEMAGVDPQEIFYTDDLAGHIAGARSAGFDAVQFTTAANLAEELRRRGVRFNY